MPNNNRLSPEDIDWFRRQAPQAGYCQLGVLPTPSHPVIHDNQQHPQAQQNPPVPYHPQAQQTHPPALYYPPAPPHMNPPPFYPAQVQPLPAMFPQANPPVPYAPPPHTHVQPQYAPPVYQQHLL
ncbi:hypothetical protein GGU11DRAFT_750213 [Lentinula aff. detonsa]|nr:hypothetical protein GGU11DRAFT_750213 [Lentinula aff. detonsa]